MGTAEAAGLLGVDSSTVIRWAQAGKLTAVHKLPGQNGSYLFSRAAVTHLASQRAQRPESARSSQRERG